MARRRKGPLLYTHGDHGRRQTRSPAQMGRIATRHPGCQRPAAARPAARHRYLRLLHGAGGGPMTYDSITVHTRRALSSGNEWEVLGGPGRGVGRDDFGSFAAFDRAARAWCWQLRGKLSDLDLSSFRRVTALRRHESQQALRAICNLRSSARITCLRSASRSAWERDRAGDAHRGLDRPAPPKPAPSGTRR